MVSKGSNIKSMKKILKKCHYQKETFYIKKINFHTDTVLRRNPNSRVSRYCPNVPKLNEKLNQKLKHLKDILKISTRFCRS